MCLKWSEAKETLGRVLVKGIQALKERSDKWFLRHIQSLKCYHQLNNNNNNNKKCFLSMLSRSFFKKSFAALYFCSFSLCICFSYKVEKDKFSNSHIKKLGSSWQSHWYWPFPPKWSHKEIRKNGELVQSPVVHCCRLPQAPTLQGTGAMASQK